MGEGSTQSVVYDALVFEHSSTNWILRSLGPVTFVLTTCGRVHVTCIRGTYQTSWYSRMCSIVDEVSDSSSFACGARVSAGELNLATDVPLRVDVPPAFEVRPFDLSFVDPALEEEFLSNYCTTNIGFWRLCHLLAIFFFAVYAVLMSITMSENMSVYLGVAVGVVTPMFAVGLALTFTRFYERYWQQVHVVYVVVTGVGALIIAVTAGLDHGFFGLTSFLFCYLFNFAVIRLRFVPATTAGLVLTLIFLSCANRVVGAGVPEIWLGVFFVISFQTLGMLIAYVFERSTRRDYHSRLLVEQERARVAAANQELESRVRQRTEDLATRHADLRAETDLRLQVEQERGELEQRYQQAQRMESIGRLAGGIAHDFNNLLMVINTCAEWIIDELRDGDPLKADVEEIADAGTRAADLTRQLLAFSRKQVLEPVVLDLNEVVRSLERMLLRIIGEDVDLQTELADDLGLVCADQGQIEQVLMNLAVNARDAMPAGGQLLIRTGEVELDDGFVATHPGAVVGAHVMVEVRDDGHGMTREVVEQIFEPFFTTKEKGRGTGLGLATVYGIVKQSEGSIWVDSTPSGGSTFTILLPRIEAERSAPQQSRGPVELRGHESVLVVEDEAAVRNVTRRMLESAGYRVTTATNGGEALLVAEDPEAEIDLILTDVVMPNMSGPRLARRIAEIRPGLKVLFMSGYTDESAAELSALDSEAKLITKPFSTKSLLRSVRQALDAPKQAGA